ncbi:Pro-opiomelanocortin B [Oryzias melastigma]|uniref:Pro-opiomelanocortin B n=1 Tax=Oryzias melastigma TaxID=30732 RepID=A0A834FBU2_ORYME|nr:pro-opiomelanocortin B [Oryzias melastigma]KAF6728369.1 Pro-opiomelanocortin B [Oryzias melastigma]
MLSLCWLVLMGCMCATTSSNDPNRKNRILDCVHPCMSGMSETPDLSGLAPPLKNDDDAELLLSIFLATLASQDKASDSDLNRRSYAMEHFRWGKPTGRKRRPVKAFASSLEEGGSSERSFPFRVRRHLSSDKNEAKGTLHEGSHQNLGLLVSRFPTRTDALQDKKEGTYRMSHFRWGSPRTSKRNGSIRKLWEETSEEKPATLLKNIIFMKDVQRKMD